MWVPTLFFAAIAITIFWLIYKRVRLRKKIFEPHHSTKQKIVVESSSDRNETSSFQEWILDYCKVKDPTQLKGKLKTAYIKNDWNRLEPSIYSKWSKYKWNI